MIGCEHWRSLHIFIKSEFAWFSMAVTGLFHFMEEYSCVLRI
uniref:Uncharacterized protein n=1 Tax=Vitis vinifera TaxID=29760 RepID=F6HAU4_VITVI